MTFENLIEKQNALYEELGRISNEIKELESKICKAKESKAQTLFDGILKSIAEMASLGFTITVQTDDAEWGGKNWHEFGMSLLDMSFTETDNQEIVFDWLSKKGGK